MLAMLRSTKTSPGFLPSTVVSGTRESQHPIQRMSGAWPFALFLKNSGSLAAMSEAQILLAWREAVNSSSVRKQGDVSDGLQMLQQQEMDMREVAYGCACMTRGRSDRGGPGKWWRACCMGEIARV